MFDLLERKIKGKLMQIKSRKVTPKESGIANLINKMKEIDEPCYIELLDKYKSILLELK